jgi:penicillin-binding protein 1A
LNPKIKRILKWTSISLLLLCIPFVLFFALVYYGYFGKLYTGKELRSIQSYLATDVYSSDKKLLGKYFLENRSAVDSKRIPVFLTNALIATEDSRFYDHNGVDTKGLFRVFFKTLLLREKNAGGGSTIGQQLAKNLLKRQDHGWLTMPVNKLKEAIHAVRFSQVYSPEEILALYLNTVSLGEDTYGIKNAAQRFYSTSADSLRIEEAAVLIGMLKSPTHYNPRLHPDNALARRNVVIDNMEKQNYLRKPVADSLKRLPLSIRYKHAGPAEGVAPYFLSHIEQLVLSLLDSIKNPEGKKYNLYTDGLKIYTTLDQTMQQYALAAMKKHMQSLQGQFDMYWKHADPWGRNTALLYTAMRNSKRYKRLVLQGYNETAIKQIFNTPQETELFDWTGGHKVFCSPFDSLKYAARQLQTGILAMDPYSGEVKVWIGGDDFTYFQYDHIKAKRQVGSTFKPIVYATAIEQGMSPCDFIKNEQKVYDQYNGWSPENAEGKYGGKYSLKGALANSVNVVSVEVILQSGIDKTIHTAHAMGIDSDIPAVPAIALGVADISLMEMVRAYCVFPNGGKRTEALLITRIEDRNGKVIYRTPKKQEPKRVLSKQTAYYMTQMMKAVVNEGTGSSLRGTYHLKEELAGKTGTTQAQADGWFIGYTPGLVAGVWVGAESPVVHFNSIAYGQGAHMALPIFGLFIQNCQSDAHCKPYLKGTFALEPGLSPMPACESFVEDNLFGKIHNWFTRKKRDRKKEESKK